MLDRRRGSAAWLVTAAALSLLAARCGSPPADEAPSAAPAGSPPVVGGTGGTGDVALARRVVVVFAEGLEVRLEGARFVVAGAAEAEAAALNDRIARARPESLEPTHGSEPAGELSDSMRRSFDVLLPAEVSAGDAQRLADDLAASPLVEEAWLARPGEAPGAPSAP
jgi:hypothetical protein